MRVIELLDILRSEAGDNPDAEVRVIFYQQNGIPLDSKNNIEGIEYNVRVNGGGMNPLNIVAEPKT
jgi:hypothetical protein